MIWLRVLEGWLITRLLASPIFHKGVRRVHRKVQEVRTGEKLYDPSEMGGTNIDKPSGHDAQKFMQYYIEELRDQWRGTTKK